MYGKVKPRPPELLLM